MPLASSDITVSVATEFLKDQSKPEQQHYVFAYHIDIHNHGVATGQLLNRHWVITDADGEVEEVQGPGVVGEQPHIAPGKSFSYSSGAILKTPMGVMQGSYEFIDDAGVHLDVPIAPFTLAIPNLVH